VKPWEQAERRVSKKTGARRQRGSGSGWLHQNDHKDERFLRESKSTEGKSISIKAEDWNKLRGNALRTGRQPIMDIHIDGQWLVLHEHDWPCDDGS
jgi:hypothetical protein